MVQKVVVNRCYGGFGLSEKAVRWMRENDYEAGYECLLAGEEYEDGSGPVDEFVSPVTPSVYNPDSDFRTSEGLIAAVEELGAEVNGDYSSLEVVEIPNDVEWEISEYDGLEKVEEAHRTW